MRLAAVTAVLAITATTARAEPEGVNDKSLGVALGLSAGGTALGIAAAAAAFAIPPPSTTRNVLFATGATAALIMPTAGHWYARGKLGDWTAGAYVRLAGACVTTLGFAFLIGRDDEVDGGPTFARGVVYGGLGLLAAGALLDIALVPSTVRRANRRPNKAIDITFVAPSGDPGVTVSGKF